MLIPGKPIRQRPASGRIRPAPIPAPELTAPRVRTVLRLVWNTVVWILHDPTAMLLGSGFLVLMLWGYHGRVDLLHVAWSGWAPFTEHPEARPQLIPGIPWDQEWLSYWIGALVVVGLPILLIKLVFRQDLRDYGLGLPKPGRWRLTMIATVVLLAVCVPTFVLGSRDPAMQAEYPLFRGPISSARSFLLYEAGYFPFFLAIEFVFRGLLLFGLFRVWRTLSGPETLWDAAPEGQQRAAPRGFGYYAILISMLSYTAWHLGKPLPETWGTLLWGVATGAIVLATGTIWPVVFVHWLLNVLLDYAIWSAR
jgi:CAAX prenyl protease-like protein